MTDASPSTIVPAYSPAPPSERALAIRKVLLIAMCVAFGAAAVVSTIYTIAEWDGYGLFTVAALIVVALNLLTWRWLTPKIDRAPTAGRKAAIAITGTLIIAALSVAAVFIVILLSLFVLGWTTQ